MMSLVFGTLYTVDPRTRDWGPGDPKTRDRGPEDPGTRRSSAVTGDRNAITIKQSVLM